jgi:hypothetical protein
MLHDAEAPDLPLDIASADGTGPCSPLRALALALLHLAREELRAHGETEPPESKNGHES